MQSTTPEHAAAIEAAETVPSGEVFIDWDGSGSRTQPFGLLTLAGTEGDQVTEVVVDRSYASGLPDGVSFVEGHAAAELRVKLTGPAAKALSPFDTASPLVAARKLTAPVTASLGMAGHDLLPAFSGVVRTVAPNSRDASCTVEALDGVERLRIPAVVPVVQGIEAVPPLYQTENKRWLHATWIIEELLATAGLRVSPPPMTGCRLYASLHGSLAPRPGYGTSERVPRQPFATDPPFIPGRHGLALYDTPATYLGPNFAVSGPLLHCETGGRVQVEFWALAPYSGGTDPIIIVAGVISDTDTFVSLTVAPATGRLSVTVKRPGQTAATALGPAVSGVAAWRYYAAHVLFSSTIAVVTTRTDLAQATQTITIGTGPTAGAGPLRSVAIANGARPAIQDLQVSDTTTASFGNSTFTPSPQVSLDPSKLWLDRTPDNPADTVWDVITDIAAAEYATVEWTETGVLRYRTADRWAEVGAAVATVTADWHIVDLAAGSDVDTVRNDISVPIATVERRRPYDRTGISLRAPVTTTVVPGGGSARIRFDLPGAFGTAPIAASLAAGWQVVTAAWGKDTGASGGIYYAGSPGTGTANNDRFVSGRLELDGQTVWINITNTTSSDAYLGSYSSIDVVLAPPSGRATDPASVALYGTRTYVLPDSDWRQQTGSAQAVADRILADLKVPQAILDRIPVIGDPRRQLGDRYRVQDPDGLALDADYWCIGIETTWRPGELSQSLTLRPVAP